MPPRTTLNQIRQQITRLESKARKLEEGASQQKQKAIAEVRATMKKLGVSLEDLQSAAPSRALRGPKKAEKSEKSDKGAGTGSTRPPVPVKFRDPESGDAWTGRGRTPRWLVAHEAQGRSREEFKVG